LKEVLLALALLVSCVCGLGCQNENGEDVDWWVIVKVPQITGTKDPFVTAGHAYLYADVLNSTLGRSSYSLGDNTTGALAITLSQIYANAGSDSHGWLMYNDELPSGTHETYAHSKGLVGFDTEEGFWLVHSVPRFPLTLSSTPTYYYPDDETKNGQSFLCVNYDIAVFEVIAKLFLINKPYVFEQNFPEKFGTILPTMKSVVDKKWITVPTASTLNIVSNGGNTFAAYAKNLQWNQDLYEDFVSPSLGLGLLVQTWREGPLNTLMPTFCTPNYTYDSVNILSMQIYDPTSTGVSWSYTKDHSKWAITISGNPYVCVGDINRMYSQYKRGGGTVCFMNKVMWHSFYSLITNDDKCTN